MLTALAGPWPTIRLQQLERSEDHHKTEQEEQRRGGAAYPDDRQSWREMVPREHRECVGREHSDNATS